MHQSRLLIFSFVGCGLLSISASYAGLPSTTQDDAAWRAAPIPGNGVVSGSAISASDNQGGDAKQIVLQLEVPKKDKLPGTEEQKGRVSISQPVSPPAPAKVASRPSEPPSPGVRPDFDMELNERIAALVRAALSRSSTTSDTNRALARYSSAVEKSKSGTKDVLLNYFGFPRGVDYSIEGSKAVLDDHVDAKSLEAAKYVLQKIFDDMHVKVVSNVMQLAMGTGAANSDSAPILKRGWDSLVQLCGQEEAGKTLSMLDRWKLRLEKVSPENDGESWDVQTFQDKLEQASDFAMKYDSVSVEVRTKLLQYKNQSNFTRQSSKIVEGTVSAITLIGGIPSVTAQLTGAGVGMARGGSEETKMLKSLYMAKSLESRQKLIDREVHLSLMNYMRAKELDNPVLLACSESCLAQLVGAVGITQILERCELPHRWTAFNNRVPFNL